jgi:hypothetical protein
VVTDEFRTLSVFRSPSDTATGWRGELGRRCRSWSVRHRCASGWWSTAGLLEAEDDRGRDRLNDIGFGDDGNDTEAPSAQATQDVFEENAL